MSDYIAAQRAAPGEVRKWVEENRIDPRRVGRRLFETFLRQMMEDNLFHGDLHPGNIMLLRESRIAFIDLGTVGTVETSFLERYMQSLKAVAEHDFGRAAELGLLLCPDIPQVDVAALKEDLVRCYREWVQRSALDNLPYAERSVMNMGNETNKVLNAYRVVLSMMYLKMARTWGTLDASLAYLIPEANYPKLIRGYFRKARKRSGQARSVRRTLLNTIAETTNSLSDLSQLLGPMLNRQALVYQGEIGRAAYAGALLVRCGRVALAGIGIFWALRWLTGDAALLPILPMPGEWQGAAALLLAWLTLGRVEQRWLRRDVRLPQAPAILHAHS
jgi:ubiquinone biosynthesis protein